MTAITFQPMHVVIAEERGPPAAKAVECHRRHWDREVESARVVRACMPPTFEVGYVWLGSAVVSLRHRMVCD